MAFELEIEETCIKIIQAHKANAGFYKWPRYPFCRTHRRVATKYLLLDLQLIQLVSVPDTTMLTQKGHAFVSFQFERSKAGAEVDKLKMDVEILRKVVFSHRSLGRYLKCALILSVALLLFSAVQLLIKTS